MNKQELLNKINESAYQIKEVRNSLFHGKCYVVATNYIQGIFKTKRGAEGYIKRNSGRSYYDEYLQELVYPSAGECFEVLESEIIEVANNKMFWYKQLRKENYNIKCGLGDNLIYEAKQSNVSEEIMQYIKESIKSLENNQGLLVYEEEVKPVGVVEESKQEEIKGISNDSEITQEINTVEFIVSEDTHTKTGEKIFIAKLTQKVEYTQFKIIENKIKSIGGYYSRFKKGFLFKEEPTQLLNDTFDNSEFKEEIENVKEIEYPEIDINDIESYTVDSKLSQRENNNSMFRRSDTDHNKEIQSLMINANNEILNVLEGNTKPYIEYKAKQYLQSWKKKYYTLYIKMLTHKANNPSWFVTGRGNLNINRYNKKQSQYEKMIGESVSLTEEFNKKISSIKWEIKKQFNEQERKETEKLMNTNIDISKFEKKTIKYNVSAVDNIFNNADKEIKVNYYQGYYIFNNWGCWRCYNEQGKEVFRTKTTGSLLKAKKKLIVLLNNGDNIAI